MNNLCNTLLVLNLQNMFILQEKASRMIENKKKNKSCKRTLSTKQNLTATSVFLKVFYMILATNNK